MACDEVNNLGSYEDMSGEEDLGKSKKKDVAMMDQLKQKLAARRPEAQKEPALGDGLMKCSVSLYARDVNRLDEIETFLREKGVRISQSAAVRLACRAVPINEQLFRTYRDMLREDKRRRIE